MRLDPLYNFRAAVILIGSTGKSVGELLWSKCRKRRFGSEPLRGGLDYRLQKGRFSLRMFCEEFLKILCQSVNVYYMKTCQVFWQLEPKNVIFRSPFADFLEK